MSKEDKDKKYKSKWFRIAVAGDTTDGREIQSDWILQMAQNYNTDTYGARINIEHIRGVMPDSVFGMYGDVLALKTEKVTIDGEEKDALFAQIEPTQSLIELNKKKQKVYTSIEIDENFANKGSAYLIGLAVTDSPASLGTEMLQFAAGAKVNPFADKKQRPENLFYDRNRNVHPLMMDLLLGDQWYRYWYVKRLDEKYQDQQQNQTARLPRKH